MKTRSEWSRKDEILWASNKKWELTMGKRSLGKQLEELWEGAPVSECEGKRAPNWQLNYKPEKRSEKNNGESPFEVLL